MTRSEHRRHHRWVREVNCDHCKERDRYFAELFRTKT